ncbi:hypothetical protein GCM10029964_056840 [Kibdelosporangium lantanae]
MKHNTDTSAPPRTRYDRGHQAPGSAAVAAGSGAAGAGRPGRDGPQADCDPVTMETIADKVSRRRKELEEGHDDLYNAVA